MSSPKRPSPQGPVPFGRQFVENLIKALLYPLRQ